MQDGVKNEALQEAIKIADEEKLRQCYCFESQLSAAEMLNVKLKADLDDSLSANIRQEKLTSELRLELKDSKRLLEEKNKETLRVSRKCQSLTKKVEGNEFYQQENRKLDQQLKATCRTFGQLQLDHQALKLKHAELIKLKKDQVTSLQSRYENVETVLKEIKVKNDAHVRTETLHLNEIKRLENNCQNLSTTLLEMKNFMAYTRAEIEKLRIENQDQTESSDKLLEQFEKLSAENIELKQRIEEQKKSICQNDQDLMSACNEMNEMEHNLKQELENVEHKLNVAVEHIKKKEKLNQSLVVEIENKAKENEYFKEECYHMVTNMEEMKKEVLSLEQSLDNEKRENSLISDENANLKAERDKLEDVIKCEKENNDAICRMNKHLCQEKLRASEIKCEESERKYHLLVGFKSEQDEKLKKSEIQVREITESFMKFEKKYNDLLLERNDMLQEKEKWNDQLQQRNQEIQSLKNEKRKMRQSIHEVQSQIKCSKESLDQYKRKNNLLQSEIKDKNENFNVSSQNQNLSLKDLQNENELIRNENKKYQNEIAEAVSYARQLQGIIDGNEYKHSWIVQHGQEQGNEVKVLKNTICELQMQLLQLKEQLVRMQFMTEKSAEEVSIKTSEVQQLSSENQNIQTQLKTLNIRYRNGVTTSEKQIGVLIQKKEENSKQYNVLMKDYDGMLKRNYELDSVAKITSEKYENAKIDLEDMKNNLEKAVKLQKITEAHNTKLKREFLKVATMLKQTKKEKDSLKAVLISCEEESVNIKISYCQQQTEIKKLRIGRNEYIEEKKKMVGENESMKSRLNIMKFTEGERVCEHRKVLTELNEAEKKLKTLKKQEEYPLSDVNIVEKTKIAKDYIQSELINDLRNVLATDIKQQHHVISPQINEMRNFLQSLKDNENVESTKLCAQFNGESMFDRRNRKTYRRKTLKTNLDVSKKQKHLSKLFEQSRILQTSLISDMKNLSINLSFENTFK